MHGANAEDELDWNRRIVGLDQRVPLFNGRIARYINLDNAASTPPLRAAVDAIGRFLPFYSSVHRGSGFKSRLSTAAYEEAHAIVARFVGADTMTSTVIFGKNTTEAINKLAYRYPFAPGSAVLSTEMEHHSNDLPWRGRATVIRARVTADGRLDEDHVDRLLAEHGHRIALVAVSGASNVTGLVQPIHRLARKAHAVGARIFVDAAQLAPHRRIDVRPADDPEHLDYVAISAHKMYAPFGVGALIGHRDTFLRDAPEYQGGGTVEIVTPDFVRWAGLPDREEAGSPNVVGAVAAAAAAQTLMDVGMERLQCREASLTAYALDRLRAIPGLTVYGPREAVHDERVGVIAFNLDSVPQALVAAILGAEAGVGVRSGCFCAQSYVARLLGLTERAQRRWHREHLAGNRSHRPGMVRISFGAYNTTDDVDVLIDMLGRIGRREYEGQYRCADDTGEYRLAGDDEAVDRFTRTLFPAKGSPNRGRHRPATARSPLEY